MSGRKKCAQVDRGLAAGGIAGRIAGDWRIADPVTDLAVADECTRPRDTADQHEHGGETTHAPTCRARTDKNNESDQQQQGWNAECRDRLGRCTRLDGAGREQDGRAIERTVCAQQYIVADIARADDIQSHGAGISALHRRQRIVQFDHRRAGESVTQPDGVTAANDGAGTERTAGAGFSRHRDYAGRNARIDRRLQMDFSTADGSTGEDNIAAGTGAVVRVDIDTVVIRLRSSRHERRQHKQRSRKQRLDNSLIHYPAP